MGFPLGYNGNILWLEGCSGMERTWLMVGLLVGLGVWIAVGVVARRRIVRRSVQVWAQVTSVLMALALTAEIVALWWPTLQGVRAWSATAEALLNTAHLTLAFWVLTLLRSPGRKGTMVMAALLALVLGVQLWSLRAVLVGAAPALTGLPYHRWVLGVNTLVLLVALVVAVYRRWQGLPRRRVAHTLFFLGLLGLPLALHVLEFLVGHLGVPNTWFGTVPVGLLWLLALPGPVFQELVAWPMERLLTEIGAGVLLFTWPEARLVWWNRQVEEWFGDRQGRVLLPRSLNEHLHQLLEREHVEELHLDTLARRFEIRTLPLKVAGRSLRALVLYDVTETHQIQQALLQQNTLEERRQRLLQMALEAPTWQELARNMVRYLAEPWPEFTPLGCALYLYDTTDVTASRARLIWGEPQDLPWAPVWEDVPPATLAPLTRTPVVDPSALEGRAHAVGIIPLLTGDVPLGVLAFLLTQEQIALWDQWLTVRRELGLLVAFLLRFAQAQEYQVLLEMAFEKAITAMAIFNHQGRPLIWNQAMEDILREQGYDPVLLLSSREETPMCDRWWRPGVWREVTQALATQGQWQHIFEQATPSGPRYWRMVAFPVHTQDHQILEIGCVVHDFTDLERARRELQIQQQLLERLLKGAHVLWKTLPSLNRLLSETLRLLKSWYPDANVSIVLLEQAPTGRLYVTAWLQETGPQPIPPFFTRLLREGALGWVIRHQETLLIEDTLTDPRWYRLEDQGLQVRSVVMAPLLYRNQPLGTLTISHREPGVFSETDRRLLSSMAQWLALALHNARLYEEQLRLQRRYRRERERLEQEQRQQVQHIDELSNALRYPLNAYLEALEAAQTRFEADAHLSRTLSRIHHLVQDMLRQLETYLDHRQLQQLYLPAHPPPPYPVLTLFREVLEILQPLAERYKTQLEWEVHPHDLTISHDRVRLRRILQYLAEFSIRRAQGGRVVLRAFYDPESTPPGVIFWVLDTGPPLETTLVDQLFQQGQDSRRSNLLPLAYHTRQMNLAVVQEYVSQLGGRLRVRQVSGFGLAFWLWIPQSAYSTVTAPAF